MKRILPVIVVLLVGLGILLYGSGMVYIVPEYKNVVITRFGKIKGAVLTGFDVSKAKGSTEQRIKNLSEKYRDEGISISDEAGLYFKLPFIEDAHFFESRILMWKGNVQNITTWDKRTLLIDSSARWRILDVVKFYETVGSRPIAKNRIGERVNSAIQDHISKTNLIEAVRNEDTRLEESVRKRLETVSEEEVESAKIRYGRKELINKIETSVSEELRDEFGIELVDVLLTQLNYTKSVQKNVYKRMRSERERIAKRYVAQGQKAKERIQGEYQRYRSEQISYAERHVEEILGTAEGRSINIWASAYEKEPDFFRFQRSLRAYENGFDSSSVFILSDDNRLMEFTTGVRP